MEVMQNSTVGLNQTHAKGSEFPDSNISGEKWVAMAVLTIVSTFCGFFPYILFTYYRRVIPSDSKLYKIIFAILSSLSGGVLLATTMLHILPEVRQKTNKRNFSIQWGFFDTDEFPIAEMLMLYGFCLIYCLEEVSNLLLKSSCTHKSHNNHKHNHNHHHKEFGQNLDLQCSDGKNNFLSPKGIIEVDCQHSELIGSENPKSDCGSNDSPTPISISLSHSVSHGSIVSLTNSTALQSPLGALRTLVSLIALSFHAVMEGIAVGVQPESDLWMAFGAIASHKCIIALCLGMEMLKSKLNWKPFLGSIFLFSVVSPLGILIGSVMVSTKFAESGWVVIVEGLASGTLLYIIFFEILATHHDHGHQQQDGDNHNHSSKIRESKWSISGVIRFLGTFGGILLAAYIISTNSHKHEPSATDHDIDHLHSHEHKH